MISTVGLVGDNIEAVICLTAVAGVSRAAYCNVFKDDNWTKEKTLSEETKSYELYMFIQLVIGGQNRYACDTELDERGEQCSHLRVQSVTFSLAH